MNDSNSRGLRTALFAAAAFFACSLAAAVVVQLQFSALLSVKGLLYCLVMVALGPPLFAWAWGPSPMTPLAIAAAVALPLAALVLTWLGFVRPRRWPWLLSAALLWSVFGGFSAFVAISGSV